MFKCNDSADINSSGPHEQQSTPLYVLLQHPFMMHVDDVSNILDTYREHRYLSQRIQSPSSNIPLGLLQTVSQPLVAINEQRRDTRIMIITARGAISTSDDINSKRNAIIRNYISLSVHSECKKIREIMLGLLMFTPVSSSRACTPKLTARSPGQFRRISVFRDCSNIRIDLPQVASELD